MSVLLTDQERGHVALLVALGLWTNKAIAEAYGVSPRTVYTCVQMYEPAL